MSSESCTTREAPRILISSQGKISDVAMAMPVACAIRSEFPDAFISWAGAGKSLQLLRQHSAINSLIEVPDRWSLSVSGISAIKAKLQPLNIGVSIDVQGAASSAWVGRLSGAEQRIGYATGRVSRVSRLLSTTQVEAVFSHQTDRALELLTPLGIHRPKVCWKINVSDSAAAWADQCVRGYDAERIAVLSPSGGAVQKRRSFAANVLRNDPRPSSTGEAETSAPARFWDAGRFAATAKYLHRKYGHRSIVVWGTFEERLMAECIVQLAGDCAVLAPSTDLQHLGGLIRLAELFIGVDSGPLHLAVAVGTPTVGLYGDTDPSRRGPYGHVALCRSNTAVDRSQRSRSAARSIRGVSVRDACDAIDEIESRRKHVARQPVLHVA